MGNLIAQAIIHQKYKTEEPPSLAVTPTPATSTPALSQAIVPPTSPAADPKPDVKQLTSSIIDNLLKEKQQQREKEEKLVESQGGEHDLFAKIKTDAEVFSNDFEKR